MKLSFIIPAFNEEPRIADTLRSVLDFFHKQDYDWEIIVVDDGSKDNTAKVVNSMGKGITLICLGQNEGKGAAVRRGMLEAKGELRIFSDADGSTPVREVENLLALMKNDADIVIGSRSLPTSNIQMRQSWSRETMGRIFNCILLFFALTHYKDTQCGFKGFTEEAAKTVFSRQRIKHFSFDVEILFIAHKHGLKIKEMPVTWRNAPHSTLHPISDSTKMLIDILKIRWYSILGCYR